MSPAYSAVIKRDRRWWIGWIAELPGVNSQARTRREIILNLQSVLAEAIEMNRADAVKAAAGEYEELTLPV